MKLMAFVKTTVLCSVFSLVVFSCKKDDVALPSKQYALYNYSSGNAVSARTFTFQQLSNGSTCLSIQLGKNYLVPNTSLVAYLTTASTINLIYATLGTVEGSSGKGNTRPVKANSENQVVKYSDLVSKSGYNVKVLNNSNIQACGDI